MQSRASLVLLECTNEKRSVVRAGPLDVRAKLLFRLSEL